MDRYVTIVTNAFIFSAAYFFIRSDLMSNERFFKTVLFYIAVHDISNQFGITREMVSLLFIGRLIAVYLEVCDRDCKNEL